MSALNSAALLTAWEQGASEPPVGRALTLLSAAWPETPASTWARLPIGARDSALLDLQDRMFGSALEAVAECPSCGSRVELNFVTDQIRTSATPQDQVKVVRDGYELEFRPATSEDLLGLPKASPQAALLARCVEHAVYGGRPVEAAELPPEITKAVIEEMAKADPQAEIRVAIECPECRNGWSMDFDIAAYLWSEVEDWAHQILRDVHALASAYGWSEQELLEMSARRRRIYLELVGG